MSIIRRRVRLGSGLDPRKLADTIQQITLSEGVPPAIICNVPGHDHGWVHLSANIELAGEVDDPVILGWILTLGYPSDEAPWILFEEAALDLPEQTTVIDQTSNIYVRLLLPGEASPFQIAALIKHIMVHIQRIDTSAGIEIALDYT